MLPRNQSVILPRDKQVTFHRTKRKLLLGSKDISIFNEDYHEPVEDENPFELFQHESRDDIRELLQKQDFKQLQSYMEAHKIGPLRVEYIARALGPKYTASDELYAAFHEHYKTRLPVKGGFMGWQKRTLKVDFPDSILALINLYSIQPYADPRLKSKWTKFHKDQDLLNKALPYMYDSI